MKNLVLLPVLAMTSLAAYSAPIAVSPMNNYTPSDVTVYEAQRLFRSLRTGDTDDSICSNRAMVWSYEMKQKYNVDSMKTFIHFSDIYQHVVYNHGRHLSWLERKFRSGAGSKVWVYHVAPSVVVDDQIYVLDKKFTKKPVTLKEWTDISTARIDKVLNNNSRRREVIENLYSNMNKYRGKNNAKYTLNKYALELIQEAKQRNGQYKTSCAEPIDHYAEHEFDKKSWCHTQNASMYYWVPGDLRKLNWNTNKRIYEENYTQRRADLGAQKYQRTSFSNYSINQSYKQAYKINLEEE